MEEVIEEEVSLFADEGEEPQEESIEAAEAEPTEDEAPAFEIPEKFAGKSIEDVIQSYVNLERSFGEKSNEVGELRKWADTLLQAQTNQPSPAKEEDFDSSYSFDDFVENPDKAVEKALKNNPTLKKFEEQQAQMHMEQSRRQLLETHPDADDIVASAAFMSWAQERPSRMSLLQQAHVNGDADVASDLIDMYKATKMAANEEAQVEQKAKAKASLKKAAVEEGGRKVERKKVYKRSELIELKVRDPQRYAEMAPEINRAYAEGRVK